MAHPQHSYQRSYQPSHSQQRGVHGILSPPFVLGPQKPPSPASSVDADHEALEKIAGEHTVLGAKKLQRYPIKTRKTSQDPLVDGLSAIDDRLDTTLLPLLSIPMPKGPDNIGNPHCRGVRGIGGSMISVAPVENIMSALETARDGKPQRNEQSPSSVRQGQGQGQGQGQAQVLHHSPAFTPSPPGMSPVEIAKHKSDKHGPSATPRSHPSPLIGSPPKPIKQEEERQEQPQPQPQSQQVVERFKTEFRFVVNEDSKTARNTVRQHVMREFRRRERWEQGKNKVGKPKKPKKDAKRATKKADDGSASQTSSTDTVMSSPDAKRRPSQTVSVSGSSDASGERNQFTVFMADYKMKGTPRSPKEAQPFAQYVGGRLALKVEDIEDAAEEIERSELSLLPYHHDPWAEVARAQINPFSQQVSLGAGPASRALLHHYAWVMPSLMDEIVTGNVFHRLGWLYSAVAVHDPTPFHTIMGFTLGHVAMLRGLDEPPLATEHKHKSLQIIHARLEVPQLAASDGSIGAIANVAAYELIDCQPERFALHMRGLARLVAQRGGMSDFALNSELETVLIRLDSIRAYVSISAPRYPGWTSVRSLTPLAINIGPPVTDWFCLPAAEHMHSYLFSEDLIRLTHNMEEVLLLVRAASPTIPFTPDLSLRELVKQYVLGHLRRDMLNAPSTFTSHVSRRVIRLAAIVLLDIAASEFFNPPETERPVETAIPDQFSPNMPKISVASSQTVASDQPAPERAAGSPKPPPDKKGLGQSLLKKRFPSIEQHRHLWGRSMEMMLAVFMQADRMALERPFRAWYVADIVTLLMKLGDAEWVAAERVLQDDLAKRILEDRKLKEQRKRNGIEQDLVWDVEDVLSAFWEEWHSGIPN